MWIPERLTPPVEDGQRGSKAAAEATSEERKENETTESPNQKNRASPQKKKTQIKKLVTEGKELMKSHGKGMTTKLLF